MKRSKTNRGFGLIEFEDTHKTKCSVQESSAYGNLWLGVSDIDPVIMAVHARKLGISTNETNGFIKYHIPEDVIMRERMHIDKKLAKKLIKILQKFVDSGTI